jgi:hypothetical protein
MTFVTVETEAKQEITIKQAAQLCLLLAAFFL